MSVTQQALLDTADARLDAGLAQLVDTATDPAAELPSADVVMLLARATLARGGRELRVATLAAADRLERSLADPLPGLRGTPGALWALVEAARSADDKALGWRALSIAAGVPARSVDPGMAHGTAGTGMAQLRLWLAYRDRRAASRVRDCVETVVRGAHPADGRIGWSGGDDRCGFADGLAGVGAFLLAAGRTIGSRAALRTADAAAVTLHGLAVRGDGPVSWPGDDAAGVGAFLVRHWAATGEPRSRELAEAAAAAGGPDPAATGQLRLDLATLLGDGEHRDRAVELARTAELSGTAGLAFLLRLRHGGPRPWLAGDLESGPFHRL